MEYDETKDPKSAVAIFRLPDIKRTSPPQPEEEINWEAEGGARHASLLTKRRQPAPPPIPRQEGELTILPEIRVKLTAVSPDRTLLDLRTFRQGRCPYGEGDPIAILDEYVRVLRFTAGTATVHEIKDGYEFISGAIDIASGEVLYPTADL